MQFNSMIFVFFLIIVFSVYWLIKDKYRWIILLISSYYFYANWNVKYVVLIALTTMVSFLCARYIEKSTKEIHKKLLLGTAIFSCIGVLVFFKYLEFFMSSIRALSLTLGYGFEGPMFSIILPVGISFYTFQTMSYVIDVYRGKVIAERHLGKYAVYISFFPQLVAGPIERSRDLLPQINKKHIFTYENATYGMKLMMWGFFKKLVIADNLAMYVDKVYNNLPAYKGAVLLIATILFSFQIYCDFSGYSDIAIGIARLFDIELNKNFASPYFATSIRTFWKRWHISLSTWFKDYLYIPLGGNQRQTLRNLLVTFVVSGVWHGANWTFVLWGFVHGVLQIVEKKMESVCKKKKEYNRFENIVATIIVFSIVSFAWMFFRANNIHDVGYILKSVFIGIENPLNYIKVAISDLGMDYSNMLKYGIALFILMFFDYKNLQYDVIKKVSELNVVVRWLIYYILIVLILGFAYMGKAQFVYFQF